MTSTPVDRVLRARDLLGIPVVTLGGDDVAEVRDVVYDSERGALLGFTLNKRAWFGGQLAELLPDDSVYAIGRDVVMIETSAALVQANEAPDPVAHAAPQRNVVGASVLTESGTNLGEVTDVILALGRKVRAVGYEVTGGGTERSAKAANTAWYIPLPEQIAISGDALIVPDEVDRFIEDDLTGFGATVREFRSQLHEPGNEDSP